MVETGAELNSASRETLLAVIAKQQTIITELRRRVDDLERRASTRGLSSGMADNKSTSEGRRSDRPEKRKPRRHRAHGFARHRMQPTRQVVHALESCPECGTGLAGDWVHRRREVIELPLSSAEVVEHVIVARTCALCRQRCMPQGSPRTLAIFLLVGKRPRPETQRALNRGRNRLSNLGVLPLLGNALPSRADRLGFPFLLQRQSPLEHREGC